MSLPLFDHPLRIAFVAPFGLRAKGTARARALPLAHELAQRGHVVALFVPPYDSPQDAGQRWAAGGVEVINMPLPGFGMTSPFGHLVVAWHLLQAVRAWQPDVVHAFKPKGPAGLVATGLWLSRQVTVSRRRATQGAILRPPLIVQDADDWEGPGGWNDDPRVGYSPLQKRFFAWQERYGLTHADAWTVTSTCLRDRTIGWGAAAERVFLLPNGLSEVGSALATSQLVLAEPASAALALPRVLLYTRFAGVRVDDVGAIWTQVRAAVPAARLLVVGRGLAGEEQQLVGLPGIEVIGWTDPTELPGLLTSAAVAIVPWVDSLPNRARHSAKVLELMAAGLPIVAFAVGELPATLGDAAVLVAAGDHAAFARAVAGLLTDREQAARLGAAARIRVRAHFSWSRGADIALQAYRMAGS